MDLRAPVVDADQGASQVWQANWSEHGRREESVMKKVTGTLAVYGLLSGAVAQAGMTVYDLSDVVRMRLEDLSFFIFLLLLASFGVRGLWNSLAKDFVRLPKLSFGRAMCFTSLLGLLMLLVLVMISGAREILTPGAWRRQESHYRPNEAASMDVRQENLESLRTVLMEYAHNHEGKFPVHDFVKEVPAKLWQSPDSRGTRYIYLGGHSLSESNALLVCEPQNFPVPRLVLLGNGTIQGLKSPEIHHFMTNSVGK